MATECREQMHYKNDQVIADLTLGYAGHALEAAKEIGKYGMLIGIDQDSAALELAKARLEALPEEDRPLLVLLHGNFDELDKLLLSVNVPGVDRILIDAGLSKMQIDNTERGFSYMEDGPLDMRMDPSTQTLNAAEIINTYNVADLTRVLRDYSDERWANRIAKFIVSARQAKPIETSGQLVEIIKAAVPASARREGPHPARRCFQALRIEVNHELDALRSGLDAAIRWLNPDGIIAVLSYHSLEDRIVKDAFQNAADRCTCPPGLPVCVCNRKPILEIVTRKPIVPSVEEIKRNPRSRSAKLRVARKASN
ncbi:MAG: 16S rRNA (cytosine(1402)-N(4))-methyltransferase RsmH [Eggerthellaceae bacterium]|nr:16S rRNA (cytosine(1402)-N(4))-methyltransferase RsmH [Eggerthellaceae bacterium]